MGAVSWPRWESRRGRHSHSGWCSHARPAGGTPRSATRELPWGTTDTVGRCRPGSRLHRDDKRHTCGYAAGVKAYAWSVEKNDFLQRERGVSFEDVVLNLQLGNEIDVFEHPNQERYPGQKISVVLIEGYAYLVPFVETEDEIFLKTIIPSRKATKHYAGGTDEQT